MTTKRIFEKLTIGSLLLPMWLSAQVTETPAMLALIEGGNPQGYVQNSNDEGIVFSTAQGRPGQLMPYSRIRGEGLDKLIIFTERAEVLAAPRALFAAGSYNEAAEAFGKVARDYAILFGVPQNFASEALFYQVESYKRAGNYAALAPIVNSPAGATIDKKLPEAYTRPYSFIKLWALFGANDFAGLKAALEEYQEPVATDDALLSVPNFKKLPSSEIAQLAYLRGRVFNQEGETDKALEDSYRSFTLAYGNDPLLAKLAMGATMVAHKADPQLEKGSKSALSEMQSIAYLYSVRYGKDTMPAEFQSFAVRPISPKVEPSPEAGAAPEGAATAPAEGAEKPVMPEEKPADDKPEPAKAKPKGKGKAAPKAEAEKKE